MQTAENRKKLNFNGFTLVELLVVISIIALLLSVLMPSLNRARRQAQNVVCLSNLKEIGIAAMLWTQGHDGWVLPAVWHVSAGVDAQGMYDEGLEPYTNADSGKNKNRKNVYSCPAVRQTNFCYGLNQYLVNNGPGPGTSQTINGAGQWGPDSVYYYTHGNTKYTGIRRPASILYFMDLSTVDAGWDSYVAAEWNVVGFAMKHYNSAPHLTGQLNSKRKSVGVANIVWMDGRSSSEPKDFRGNCSIYLTGQR